MCWCVYSLIYVFARVATLSIQGGPKPRWGVEVLFMELVEFRCRRHVDNIGKWKIQYTDKILSSFGWSRWLQHLHFE